MNNADATKKPGVNAGGPEVKAVSASAKTTATLPIIPIKRLANILVYFTLTFAKRKLKTFQTFEFASSSYIILSFF